MPFTSRISRFLSVHPLSSISFFPLRCEHYAVTNIIIIIIIASHEDEMNDKYNDKLCTSNEVISE